MEVLIRSNSLSLSLSLFQFPKQKVHERKAKQQSPASYRGETCTSTIACADELILWLVECCSDILCHSAAGHLIPKPLISHRLQTCRKISSEPTVPEMVAIYDFRCALGAYIMRIQTNAVNDGESV